MRLLVPMRECEALLTYGLVSPEPASSGDSSVAEHGDRNDSNTPIAEVRDSQVIARSRRLTTLEMLRGRLHPTSLPIPDPETAPAARGLSAFRKRNVQHWCGHIRPRIRQDHDGGARSVQQPLRQWSNSAATTHRGRVAPPLKLAFAGRHDDLFIAFRMKPTTRMISLTRGHAPAGTRLGIGRTRPRYGAPPAARHKATQSRGSFGPRRRSRALGRATSPLSRTRQTSP